ncbi:Hpt domain-containing protein [Flavobacteriaceae sp. LMIT009]
MEQPNLSYIYGMSGGDETFEKKIIDIIKKELPQEKDVYYLNIQANNYKEAAKNVHKLKHKISILGLVSGYEVAVNFENNLEIGRRDGQEEFEAILVNMTNFLDNL